VISLRRQWPLLLLAVAACSRDTAPAAPMRMQTTAAPAASASTAPAHPAVIVPNPRERAWELPGTFAPDDDLARLQRRFGAGNVRAGEVPGAEGETVHGAILFPDDPSRRAYLYFQDTRALHGLSLVQVLDTPSRWHFDNGVAPGMPLARLLVLNQRPIRFTGFDWDYGGAISDWNGGRLQQPDDDPVRRGIRLTHGEAPDGAYPLGDDTFSSDDPRYPRLGEVVSVDAISISFPGEDDL
jgi:hypothetical protein